MKLNYLIRIIGLVLIVTFGCGESSFAQSEKSKNEGKAKTGVKKSEEQSTPKFDWKSPEPTAYNFLRIGRDIDRFTYFLDEIGIVDDQAEKLKKAAKQFFDDQSKLNNRSRKLVEKRIQAKTQAEQDEINKAFTELHKEEENLWKPLYDSIEDALLPYQMERLRTTLYQRAMHLKTSSEIFEFPLELEADGWIYQMPKGFFGMPKKELDKLKKVTAIERAEYFKVRDELREKAWKKVMDAMPERMRDEWEVKFGKRYDRMKAQEYDTQLVMKRIEAEKEAKKKADENASDPAGDLAAKKEAEEKSDR